MTNFDDFTVLDQEFLPADLVRQETLKTLATLELRKHRIRMEAVVQGSDQAKLESGETLAQALEATDKQIAALKAKFAEVLFAPAPVAVDAAE